MSHLFLPLSHFFVSKYSSRSSNSCSVCSDSSESDSPGIKSSSSRSDGGVLPDLDGVRYDET